MNRVKSIRIRSVSSELDPAINIYKRIIEQVPHTSLRWRRLRSVGGKIEEEKAKRIKTYRKYVTKHKINPKTSKQFGKWMEMGLRGETVNAEFMLIPKNMPISAMRNEVRASLGLRRLSEKELQSNAGPFLAAFYIGALAALRWMGEKVIEEFKKNVDNDEGLNTHFYQGPAKVTKEYRDSVFFSINLDRSSTKYARTIQGELPDSWTLSLSFKTDCTYWPFVEFGWGPAGNPATKTARPPIHKIKEWYDNVSSLREEFLEKAVPPSLSLKFDLFKGKEIMREGKMITPMDIGIFDLATKEELEMWKKRSKASTRLWKWKGKIKNAQGEDRLMFALQKAIEARPHPGRYYFTMAFYKVLKSDEYPTKVFNLVREAWAKNRKIWKDSHDAKLAITKALQKELTENRKRDKKFRKMSKSLAPPPTQTTKKEKEIIKTEKDLEREEWQRKMDQLAKAHEAESRKVKEKKKAERLRQEAEEEKERRELLRRFKDAKDRSKQAAKSTRPRSNRTKRRVR